MTYERTSSASNLQPSSPLTPQPHFGRRAFGHQRRMSQATIARNIVESILTHRTQGIDRKPSFYGPSTETLALVEAALRSRQERGL